MLGRKGLKSKCVGGQSLCVPHFLGGLFEFTRQAHTQYCACPYPRALLSVFIISEEMRDAQERAPGWSKGPSCRDFESLMIFLGLLDLVRQEGFTVSHVQPGSLPTGASPPSAPMQAARLCLSHQVQVIHVAAAPGLPVGTSASPGCHDNGMQGTGASVGCGSQRGSATDKGGACFILLWEAWQGLEPWGWEPLPASSLGISFLPSVLGAGGGAGVPSLVGGVWEQMGGVEKTALPIQDYAPPPPLKLFPGPSHSMAFFSLASIGSSRPSLDRKLVPRLGAEPGEGGTVGRRGPKGMDVLCASNTGLGPHLHPSPSDCGSSEFTDPFY